MPFPHLVARTGKCSAQASGPSASKRLRAGPSRICTHAPRLGLAEALQDFSIGAARTQLVARRLERASEIERSVHMRERGDEEAAVGDRAPEVWDRFGSAARD